MAWTALTLGADFAVAEIVTASKMNTHLTDNLRYLHGDDGRTVVNDGLTIPLTAGTNGKGLRFGDGSNQYGNVQTLDSSGVSYLFISTNRYQDGTAHQQLNARAGGLLLISQDTLGYYTYAAASSTPVQRLQISNNGNMGIGTATPAGPLEVKGTAGSRIMMLFADNVDSTLQTIAPAGTCVAGATFFIMDRNNTGGTCFQGASGAACQLGGSSSYNNTDTITYAVTAGGAITVQRTTGSNGTHDLAILAFVF